MTCHDALAHLSEYLDRTLDADTRAAVDAHVQSCDACKALVADLDRIRTTAHTLGPITPPAHVWRNIAAELRTTQRRADTWQWLGLAAALLLVTAGVYMVAQPDTASPLVTADGNASAPPTVETVEDTLRRAEAEYERAIAMLEKVVKDGNQNVSPDTLATLQRNVTTIDSAIAESRAALTDNPASQPARTSLFDALRNKVNLLQSTVVLMNEMRQGDAGGAAEAAAGLGNKTS